MAGVSSPVRDTHAPVMLAEMLAALAVRDGETYVDGTFGAGGYTGAILETPGARVVAFDRDPAARVRYDLWPEDRQARCVFIDAPFSAMRDELTARGLAPVDGVVLDLGVSSPQLDVAERGFSFRFDGPLDMRMDPRVGVSAADVVNQTAEADLANLIYDLGEEKQSRAVARAIVAARKIAPITTTQGLAGIVRSVVRKSGKDGIDPATRTFQALRIFVNDELGELRRVLVAAVAVLRAGGRLVVVTFHSLEDRIVKQFFTEYSGRAPAPSRFMPAVGISAPSLLAVSTARAVSPGAAETSRNPRARSAHLRVAVRTEAPLPVNFMARGAA
jgi:16S rRNA (cytosine1402-N4)-methyltransferase